MLSYHKPSGAILQVSGSALAVGASIVAATIATAVSEMILI
ncbi:hypothetical protein [Mycobacterium sp.]